ncbi:MAG TPA: hypothetical protein PKE55_12780 [Kiritimatiellia bacterium]|nr:hypothetical protein [Kiritimatiellia bacterium]
MERSGSPVVKAERGVPKPGVVVVDRVPRPPRAEPVEQHPAPPVAWEARVRVRAAPGGMRMNRATQEMFRVAVAVAGD